jgi:broad-specificity NMP kinase
VEFDTTHLKSETIARRVLDIIKGRSKPSFGNVDWLSNITAATLLRELSGKYHTFNRP